MKSLIRELLSGFPTLVSRVEVPNAEGDRTKVKRGHLDVLKIGLSSDPHSPSVLITAAHHARELTSI